MLSHNIIYSYLDDIVEPMEGDSQVVVSTRTQLDMQVVVKDQK